MQAKQQEELRGALWVNEFSGFYVTGKRRPAQTWRTARIYIRKPGG
jgi:hypothetical protein